MQSNTENKTKILSRKKVFQSTYFHIDNVEIERDGHAFTKDIIQWGRVVCVLPVTDKKELYLISEYRDAFEKRLLEVVGGQVDEGEELLDAAKRELKEETGLTAKHWKQLHTFYVSPNINMRTHFFLAQDLSEGTVAQEKDEDIKVVKMSLDEAVAKTLTGEIPVGIHVAAILQLEKLQEKWKIE